MRKKLLKASSWIGLFLFSAYSIWHHAVAPIPDVIANPIMFVSVLLMLVGVAYDFYSYAKSKNSGSNE
ncbi:MAG: hypothetical protein Q4G58_02255 [bacterium]|nr:hypothetical protein [bacterium]